MTQYWIQVRATNWAGPEPWVVQDDLHGNEAALVAFWDSEQRAYGGDDDRGDKPPGTPVIILSKDESHGIGQALPHACARLAIDRELLPTDGVVRVIIHDGPQGALANANLLLCKELVKAVTHAGCVQFIKRSNNANWVNREDYVEPEIQSTGACVAKYLLKGPEDVDLSSRVTRAKEWLSKLESAWDRFDP
jgi:hypothetical protein